MSLQHIQKNSPRLLPKPAKFEKNPPNGYRVIRKTKCGAGGAGGAGGAAGAGGAGGAGSSPIHKQASLAGRLINFPREASHSFLGFFWFFFVHIYIYTTSPHFWAWWCTCWAATTGPRWKSSESAQATSFK